jgi:hypothetical protein
VLADFPEGEVQVQEFADKMKAAILPLTSRTLEEEERYESISLPEDLRGPVAAYYEKIYQSPIKTSAGSVHFDDSIDSYFAHTRIEDLPVGTTRVIGKDIMGCPIYDIPSQADRTDGTRRVIEIQSDLFQKGRLENEPGISTTYALTEKEAAEALKRGEKVYALELSIDGDVKIGREIKSPQDLSIAYDGYVAELQDRTHLAKLEPYRDTWYERIIGEEIKRAARDGNTLLQFPTGETAMKIEGLGNTENWLAESGNQWRRINETDLKVGGTIVRPGEQEQWIITDVLEDGKFKAVPKDRFDRFLRNANVADDIDIDNRISYARHHLPRVFDDVETFDISGKVDVTNPIYRFYEHRIQRCLKRIKPDLERVTDERGVTWFQVQLTPDDVVRPVAAFGIARSPHSGS